MNPIVEAVAKHDAALAREVQGEFDYLRERIRLREEKLASKSKAMDVLFARMLKANVDYSDLIP